MSDDFDMGSLMQQAQQMQEQMAYLQKGLEGRTVEGTAGAGMVKVTATGTQQITAVEIDPSVLGEDKEMVQDLIVAAVNNALEKSKALAPRDPGLHAAPGVQAPGVLRVTGTRPGGVQIEARPSGAAVRPVGAAPRYRRKVRDASGPLAGAVGPGVRARGWPRRSAACRTCCSCAPSAATSPPPRCASAAPIPSGIPPSSAWSRSPKTGSRWSAVVCYRGRYHVLHGVLDPLAGVGPDDLKIDMLLRRLESKPEEPPVAEGHRRHQPQRRRRRHCAVFVKVDPTPRDFA